MIMVIHIMILLHFLFLANPETAQGIPETFLEIAPKKMYVDKTGLLIDFINDHNIGVYLSAPRRFGKTINCQMIQNFFCIGFEEDGYTLITDRTKHHLYNFFKTELAHLQVVKDENFFEVHFGNYIVINIVLSVPVANSVEDLKSQLDYKIYNDSFAPFKKWWSHSGIKVELCERGCLVCCDILTMIFEKYNETCDPHYEWDTGIRCLFENVRDYYHKKVILLVDEFDNAVLLAMQEFTHEAARNILKYLSNIFGDLTRTVSSQKSKGQAQFPVYKSFFTGIIHLPTVSSRMNNFQVYNYFKKHAFSEYYGFHQIEVDALLDHYKHQDKRNQVKQFYDGYKVIKANWTNYNPLSIVKFLISNGEIKSYWRKTATVTSWFEFCRYPGIFGKIESLALGKTVDLNILVDEKLDHLDIIKQVIDICNSGKTPSIKINPAHKRYFFMYLLQEGYLSPAESSKETCYFTAPNEEIQQEYCDIYGSFVNKVVKVDVNSIANMFWTMADTGSINDKHVDELSDAFNRLVQYRIETGESCYYNEPSLLSLVYISCKLRIEEPFRNEFVFAEIQTVYQDFINLMQSDGVSTTHKPLGGKKYEKADVYLKLHDGKTIMIIKFKGDGNIEKAKDQVVGYRPIEEDKADCKKLVLVWVSVNRRKTLQDEIKVSLGCYIVENYDLNPDNPVARECAGTSKKSGQPSRSGIYAPKKNL